MKKPILFLAACLLAMPLFAADHGHAAKKNDTTTIRSTVEAVDHTARTVTLKDKHGRLVTLFAGPDVQGFDQLKVGDKVTFNYTEGTALKIQKSSMTEGTPQPPTGSPSEDSDRPSTSGAGNQAGRQPTDQPGTQPGSPGASASGGVPGTATDDGTDRNGATIGQAGTMTPVTGTATVREVDPKGRWITFETEDGHLVSTRVEDRDLVKDLQPGDQIDITYTNSALLSVEPSGTTTSSTNR